MDPGVALLRSWSGMTSRFYEKSACPLKSQGLRWLTTPKW